MVLDTQAQPAAGPRRVFLKLLAVSGAVLALPGTLRGRPLAQVDDDEDDGRSTSEREAARVALREVLADLKTAESPLRRAETAIRDAVDDAEETEDVVEEAEEKLFEAEIAILEALDALDDARTGADIDTIVEELEEGMEAAEDAASGLGSARTSVEGLDADLGASLDTAESELGLAGAALFDVDRTVDRAFDEELTRDERTAVRAASRAQRTAGRSVERLLDTVEEVRGRLDIEELEAAEALVEEAVELVDDAIDQVEDLRGVATTPSATPTEPGTESSTP